MRIQSHVWHVAKDSGYPAEYEDAFYVSDELQRAAIADGVGSAIFSGRWARLLTRQLVECPPAPDQWLDWLSQPRQAWLEDINFPGLPLHQKNKLRQVGGSYSTLCWLHRVDISEISENDHECRFSVSAIGDSCLFLIRDSHLVFTFPLTNSQGFGVDPDSVCSVPGARDSLQKPVTAEFTCQAGDIVMLATDALGDWLFTSLENGDSAPWARLWHLSEDEWRNLIEDLRNRNQLKRDDTTMILLSLGEDTPPWKVPPPQDSNELLIEAAIPEVLEEHELSDESCVSENPAELPMDLDQDVNIELTVVADLEVVPLTHEGDDSGLFVSESNVNDSDQAGDIGTSEHGRD